MKTSASSTAINVPPLNDPLLLSRLSLRGHGMIQTMYREGLGIHQDIFLGWLKMCSGLASLGKSVFQQFDWKIAQIDNEMVGCLNEIVHYYYYSTQGKLHA